MITPPRTNGLLFNPSFIVVVVVVVAVVVVVVVVVVLLVYPLADGWGKIKVKLTTLPSTYFRTRRASI